MNRHLFYVLMLAVIAAIIYAYYSLPEKPDKGINLTPKDYIERLEKQPSE